MEQKIIIYAGGVATLPPDDLEIVEMWVRSKRSAGTQAEYRRDFNSFLRFYLDTYGSQLLSIKDITVHVLQDYEHYLVHVLDRRPNTVGRKLAMLKSLLTFMHELGLTQFNMGKMQKLPQDRETLVDRLLSPEQVQTILRTAEAICNVRDCAIVHLMYGAGVRTSEVCALQWKDLQQTRQGYQLNVFGKGSKKRYVALHPALWNRLQNLKAENVKSNDYIFPSGSNRNKGGRLNRSSVYKLVKRVMLACGIEEASSHWLRHAHADASLNGEHPVPLKVLMDTMGHKDMRTASKYQHVRPGDSSSVRLDLW